jgi:hypothetical protein
MLYQEVLQRLGPAVLQQLEARGQVDSYRRPCLCSLCCCLRYVLQQGVLQRLGPAVLQQLDDKWAGGMWMGVLCVLSSTCVVWVASAHDGQDWPTGLALYRYSAHNCSWRLAQVACWLIVLLGLLHLLLLLLHR